MLTETQDSYFWKAVEYLFYLFFITFPFLHYGSFLYSGTSTRSLNLIVFAGALGIAFGIWLFTKEARVSVAKSPLLAALLLYFLAVVVSGAFGLNFLTSFWSTAARTTGIWYLVSLGVFTLLLWPILEDRVRHTRLILAVVLSAALYSVLDLLAADGFGLIGNPLADAYTFGNSSFAAMYIFAAFLLSLWYLFQSEKRTWWMYLLPAVLLVNPNILSARIWYGDLSRGLVGEARATTYVIVLSLVMLGALWLISRIRDGAWRARASYGLFGIGVLGVLLASYSLLSPGGYLRTAYLETATAARPVVWEIAQGAIAERPFLGWGMDTFERVFEQRYDNRLLEERYGNEAWFDRAHNFSLDQMLDTGAVGLLLYFAVYVVTVLALIYTALHAPEKRDRIFAAVLIVYFTLHIAELQTAFETSISYPMLAFLFVSAAVLYHRARSAAKPDLAIEVPRLARYGAGAALILFFTWSLVFGAYPFLRAQIANGAIRTVGSADERMPLYPTLFASPVDAHAFLWRTSTDFQRGIAKDPQVLNDPKKVESLKKEIAYYEQAYRDYLEKNPTHFRAHLNLADILMYQMLFGVNKLMEAQDVLDQAIELVPQAPQPYWMKAVAALYTKRFNLARSYAEQALELNPEAVQSKEVAKYIEESVQNFPFIDLYFFPQI